MKRYVVHSAKCSRGVKLVEFDNLDDAITYANRTQATRILPVVILEDTGKTEVRGEHVDHIYREIFNAIGNPCSSALYAFSEEARA